MGIDSILVVLGKGSVMILVAVGTQLPFDRLIRTVDDWAAGTSGAGIFAQIGPSSYRPKHVQWAQFLTPAEFQNRAADADLIISHAGVGLILTALELCKPAIIMPRREELGEHRNDHQLATAGRFCSLGNIKVALTELQLLEMLEVLDLSSIATAIPPYASPELLACLRDFIRSAPRRGR